MSLEIIISVFALLVSIIVAVYSFIQGKTSNELQERVVNIEEQREKERLAKQNKADLRVSFDYGPGNGSYKEIASHITIKNEGKVKAENIRMYVNDEPVTQHKYMMQHHDHKLNPISPGSISKWILTVEEDTPEVCEVHLLWDDETGTNYEFKEKLPLKK